MQVWRSGPVLLVAVALVLAAAAMPGVALAGEESSRVLARTAGSTAAILYTVGAGLALMLVATLGYMYLRVRDLHWDFQQPDSGGHHDAGGHH